MPEFGQSGLARRRFLTGAAVVGALSLPGLAPRIALAATPAGPVQRLLALATKSAFTRLSAPYGFWGSRVARFGLPVLFSKGAIAGSPLSTSQFRMDLVERLNRIAEVGAQNAAATVEQAARSVAVADPSPILRGAPTSATSYLRLEMGSALVNALVPPLEAALTAAQDPIVAQAVAALPGVTLNDVAHSIALAADNGIWYEIGASEISIRANPEASGDAELAVALRAAAAAAAASAPAPMPAQPQP